MIMMLVKDESTWAADLARVVVALTSKPEGPWGTYHASGEGRCTWHEFALAILDEGRARALVDPAKAVAAVERSPASRALPMAEKSLGTLPLRCIFWSMAA